MPMGQEADMFAAILLGLEVLILLVMLAGFFVVHVGPNLSANTLPTSTTITLSGMVDAARYIAPSCNGCASSPLPISREIH